VTRLAPEGEPFSHIGEFLGQKDDVC
jgi:hypothetical protein